MLYTIVDTVNHSLSRQAAFIIHKHDCANTRKRDIFPDMLHTVEAESVEAAEEKFRRDWYSDFETESQDMFACRVMPCCK